MSKVRHDAREDYPYYRSRHLCRRDLPCRAATMFMEIRKGLTKFLTAVRFIGIWGILRSVHYALIKQWIAWRFRRPLAPRGVQTPGRILNAEPYSSGVRFRFEHAELEIQLLAQDLVRVTWGPAPALIPYALAKTDWPDVAWTLREGPPRWEIVSEALRVEIDEDGSLRFRDPSGHTLRQELPPLRRGEEVIHQARLRPEARVFGLGNRAVPWNPRGGVYRMWNRDPGAGHRPGDDPIYLCIPVFLVLDHQGSSLIFYENSYPATLTVGEVTEMRFEGGSLRFYVIPGPPARALERYAVLTGKPPLPPRWALGYHQSRWTYGSDAEVREVAAGFHNRGLPLSAIHLDIDYMDGFRVFTVDTKQFPNLAALTRDLADRGVFLVTILDPGVKQDRRYDVFNEGLAENAFCTLPDKTLARAPVWPGWCAFPDFTDPRARAWWGRQYPRLLDAGITGFWHDMNEPAAFAIWGDPTLPHPTRHALDGRGGDHREAHNLYGLLMNQAGYQALRAHRPQRRPFILSRSGWAGVQRYAWNWTGDVESTWEALRQTVATVLGLALSGIAFTGPDVGGFSGTPSAELYLRWFQLAAFLPFFRTHSAKFTPRREPWSFGEPTLSIAREFLKLRYRLLPYLYTLAWTASQTGHPLVRPLFWPDGKDPNLWDVQDEFLLGESLLVAPVLEQGAHVREVILPEGTWYGLFDDGTFRGPGRVSIATPIDRLPVLVREGSVLPMEESGHGATRPTLVLHVYPRVLGEGDGMLYTDAGDGYGPGRLDRFSLSWEGETLRLSRRSEGEYPFPYETIEVQVHGMSLRRAVVDGAEISCEGNRIQTGHFDQASFEP